MKKIIILAVLIVTSLCSYAQEFKVITIVESIVPMGIGRSRIIENQGAADVGAMTTERDGDHSNAKDVKRKDIKKEGENLKETKLVNFYSIAGINFGNIAANDAVIAAKMNEMTANGWELIHITSAVESDAGKDDGEGIFITRLFFKK